MSSIEANLAWLKFYETFILTILILASQNHYAFTWVTY